MKRCSGCKIEKPLDEFYNNKSKKDGKHHYCKTCQDPKIRTYQRSEAGKASKRRSNLRSRYSLDLPELERMWQAQEGKCAICKEGFPLEDLVVDHHHESGAVRGLLCQPCNNGLGRFRDDPVRLLAAAKYLGCGAGHS